ncbi:hypothetical protein RND81_04G108200 [Saponaria officinalis]|uniref:Uncharacterized protein n=1 Tax=Saponaria officinalis TaxID=3572 RepID=A0AAW1LIA3_SAPOF
MNPYELIRNSIKILAKHKVTFNHVDDKKDACSFRLVWLVHLGCLLQRCRSSRNQTGFRKDTYNEFQTEGEKHSGSSDFGFATRLRDIKENVKFRYLNSTDEYSTLPEFFNFLKTRYGLKCIYMWHAILGCWGGVLPSSEALTKYSPKLVYPIQSPGNVANVRDVAMDGIEKYGMGVIDPEKISEFYSDYHCYLASIGVDGVKVDIQNVVETIGSGYGGRVRMTAMYLNGLEEAVSKNFRNNNLICSMCHNTDSLFRFVRRLFLHKTVLLYALE